MDVRRGAALLFVSAVLALAACEGGDSVADPGSYDPGPLADVPDPGTPDVADDTTTDRDHPETGTEVVADTAPEASPDVAPDVAPEVAPDVIPEVAPDVIPEVAPDVIPEVAPDAVPDVVPDVAPDVAGDALPDADPGVPDGVGDTVLDPAEAGPDTPACTCLVTSDCCDGCHPIGETQPCSTGTACMVGGTCSSGVCTGETPVECPAPGACQVAPGTCNPQTNACEFAPAADSTSCEAVIGKDDSGLCLAGSCIGFGSCDHRTYDQPIGSACNFGGECASGRCAAWGDEWTTFCTAPCGSALPACPADTACVRSGSEMLCRPMSADRTLPNDASHDAFQVCNHDGDCAGDLCLGIDGKKFCTKSCDDGTGKASDALCAPCGECRENGEALGFKHKFYCVPSGLLDVGQPCGQSGDCAQQFCHNGLCSAQCFVIEEFSSCPDNMECIPGVFESDPDVQVCVPKGESGRGFGEDCVADYACEDGRTCEAVLGRMICTAVCSEEIPCAEGTCVETAGGFVCVPPELLGTVPAGEACDETFQCMNNLFCFQGACLKGCEDAADCPEGGVCYPDYRYQVMYCTTACPDGTGCPGRMGCFEGTCVLGTGGLTYVQGPCRLDADCETGLCIGGTCTETCSATLPCEGSAAIEPVPYGECQPCNPAYYGADCNPPDTYGLNDCIEGADGKYFCALSCLMSPACPVGTRCYDSGYMPVCAPLSGSCSTTISCTSKGYCIRPAADGAPCGEDAECSGRKCVGGLCRTGTCGQDADCECDALACTQGDCRVSPSFGVAEVEPNDTVESAQVLPAGTVRVAGAIRSDGNTPDVDLYRVSLKAGEALDLRTQPFCGAPIDTVLRLRDASGAPLENWENDDLSQYDYSSILLGYVAFQDQDVLVEVVVSPLSGSFLKFAYTLEMRVFKVAPVDTCEGAETLTPGSYSLDLVNSLNTYTAASCTGYPAFGKDSAYRIDVPAGHALRASIDALFDAQLYVVTDCAQSEGTCVAGADALEGPGLEELVWWNRTGASATVYLVADSWLPAGDMTFNLTVAVDPVTTPVNDGPDEPSIPLLVSPAKAVGTLVGANNDYDPTATGCGSLALVGPDVVYKVLVEAGGFATFEITRAVGFAPKLWVVTDLAEPATCLAAGDRFVSWANTTDAAVLVYVIVDVEKVDGYGDFELLAEFGASGPCFGPCDPETYDWTCVAEGQATLCICDDATRRLLPKDCDGLCKADGKVAGTCHVFTTTGYEGASCMCEWSCDDAAGQCAEGYYTNCTCGAADPCQWQANGQCNEFCAIEYPADHFEDPPADCPPAT